jgi:hypothetical protein
VCPKCGENQPIDVKLEALSKNTEGGEDTAELVHLTFPGEALVDFEQLFKPLKRNARDRGQASHQERQQDTDEPR